MTQNEMGRNALFNRINELSFACLECVLFLDTHPDDAEALRYYNNQCALLDEAIEAYETRFGPLTIYGGSDGDRWDWIRGPWPWQTAAEDADTMERTARYKQI